MKYFIVISVVLFFALVYLFLRRKSSQIPNEDNQGSAHINLNVTTDSEDIHVDGSIDEFIITVDDRFSFLVQAGVIVGYRDNMKSNDFKKYIEAG